MWNRPHPTWKTLLEVGRIELLGRHMDESEKEKFYPIKSELYQLLLSAYCYNQKITKLPGRLQDMTRDWLLEEITALRHMANGIILHLCNLDDESSEWSLRNVAKKLAKYKGRPASDDINKLLKEYRAELNRVNTKYRNQYIAHRNSEEYPNQFNLPDYRRLFAALIQKAVSICDRLWGSQISYGFKLGSLEGTIDFRIQLNLT